jgi:hypothetical protein
VLGVARDVGYGQVEQNKSRLVAVVGGGREVCKGGLRIGGRHRGLGRGK